MTTCLVTSVWQLVDACIWCMNWSEKSPCFHTWLVGVGIAVMMSTAFKQNRARTVHRHMARSCAGVTIFNIRASLRGDVPICSSSGVTAVLLVSSKRSRWGPSLWFNMEPQSRPCVSSPDRLLQSDTWERDPLSQGKRWMDFMIVGQIYVQQTETANEINRHAPITCVHTEQRLPPLTSRPPLI